MPSRKMVKIATIKAGVWKDSDGNMHWQRIGTIHSNGAAVSVWLSGFREGTCYGMPEEGPARPHIEGFLTARIIESVGDEADQYQHVGFISTMFEKEDADTIRGYRLRLDCLPICQRQFSAKNRPGLWLSIHVEDNMPFHIPNGKVLPMDVPMPTGPWSEVLHAMLLHGVSERNCEVLIGRKRDNWTAKDRELILAAGAQCTVGHWMINPYNLQNNTKIVKEWIDEQRAAEGTG